MSRIKNVTHHTIFKHDAHCVNQIATRVVARASVHAFVEPVLEPGQDRLGMCRSFRKGRLRSIDGATCWSA